MAPLNALETWSVRSGRETKQPKSKCFIVSEGANTEYWYLESLALRLAKMGVPELIELKPVKRTGGERDDSAPKKLAEHAKRIIEDEDGEFGYDDETDRVVMVFDADIYKGREAKFLNELAEYSAFAQVAVTYPSFELFLLLHLENAIREWIEPNKDAILKNDFVGASRRYLDRLASEALGMNVKKNSSVGNLAVDFDRAAAAEKELNQNPRLAIGRLTSNVGAVISGLIQEGSRAE